MTKLNLERTADNKLITDIKELKRDREAKRSDQASTFYFSNVSTLSATLPANGYYYIDFVLTSNQDKRTFGLPEIALFKNSIDGDNLYPNGVNWSVSDVLNTRMNVWYEPWEPANKPTQVRVLLVSTSGSSLDFIFVGRFRYLKSGTL